ncbi:hypothetical protein V6N13_024331 [Hibiscus sabdariffa]|uniref:Uncharacterized protein n=2 Tax=Hibiscus sabdariffa TaxID=183260 RepID=A0ABR2B428_9ROSI
MLPEVNRPIAPVNAFQDGIEFDQEAIPPVADLHDGVDETNLSLPAPHFEYTTLPLKSISIGNAELDNFGIGFVSGLAIDHSAAASLPLQNYVISTLERHVEAEVPESTPTESIDPVQSGNTTLPASESGVSSVPIVHNSYSMVT